MTLCLEALIVNAGIESSIFSHANPAVLPLDIVHKRWRFEHDESRFFKIRLCDATDLNPLILINRL